MAHPISPQWVIKEVTYYDHATHRFLAGDIEIAGERIDAIKAPGTSTYACAFDARAYVCTPGLVKAQADWHSVANESEHLLREGITTAGTLCATASECVVAASRSRLRPVTRLLVNPVARARSAQRRPDARAHSPELHAFARIDALVRRNAGRLALAVHCPSIVSAYELAYAHNLATALRLPLGFVLSSDETSARDFRDRFYSSEARLLGFMQLLRPGISVWGRSQLTRNDIEILATSGADVIGWDAASLVEHRSGGRTHAGGSAAGCTSGFSSACASDMPRLAVLLDLADSHVNCDRCVDAATVGAATALGDRACGRIAPGMRADLCLFSSSRHPLPGSSSEAFVELFEYRRPDAVIVAGVPRHGLVAVDLSASTCAPAHIGARACPPPTDINSIKTALL